ncbi:MAG: 1-acyl-sn-glycerol-3-phosphate acyltransferase [Bacteroidales bacterium]|jgi:1-acyl-sn-glycerol-3-phosphate acyltransferase|nr:1-acyl-sn-glycerol-3-phosphate acyltransferase [Bacteroidales bacterium]MDG2080301.1 1-acyl-sn-glycerol-3-phosphate acyltransferase [Bacteroidales bacterium]
MGLHNIEKSSLSYNLLKAWLRFWHNKVYYKSFIVFGEKEIPVDKPIIFTINHQNALMDALALLFTTNRIVVFVARADIFKNSKIAAVLYFLKILPIYRVRDGFDNVKKSKNIIGKTTDIITSGASIGILPEGNHSRFRRLRPLKKGFARIAFQTMELNDFNMDLQVVPVGVDYDNFSKYRSSLIVNFGKAIPVNDFTEIYKENNPIGINKLKETLSKNMAPTILNILSVDNYDYYNEIRVLYRYRMAKILGISDRDEHNRLIIDQETVSKLEEYELIYPKKVYESKILTESYVDLRNKLGFTNSIIKNNGVCWPDLFFGFIYLLATVPAFIYGYINNFIPYYLSIWVSSIFEDEQFKSSAKFVVSAISFPLFYILQSLLVLIITDPYITVIYMITLPLSAIICWQWTRTFTKTYGGLRYLLKSLLCDKLLKILRELHTQIIASTDQMMS